MVANRVDRVAGVAEQLGHVAEHGLDVVAHLVVADHVVDVGQGPLEAIQGLLGLVDDAIDLIVVAFQDLVDVGGHFADFGAGRAQGADGRAQLAFQVGDDLEGIGRDGALDELAGLDLQTLGRLARAICRPAAA